MALAPPPRRALLAAAAAAVATLSACGTSAAVVSQPPAAAAPASTMPMNMTAMPSAAAAPAAPVATDRVTIGGFAFGPGTVRVAPGTTVTWTQQDEDSHTVTADDGSFTSKALTTGQTYTHTFSAPGTYHYHCSIHPFMHGTVVVGHG